MSKKKVGSKANKVDTLVMRLHSEGKAIDAISKMVGLDEVAITRIIKNNLPPWEQPCPKGCDPEKWAKQMATLKKNANSVGARIDSLAGLVGMNTSKRRANQAQRSAAAAFYRERQE